MVRALLVQLKNQFLSKRNFTIFHCVSSQEKRKKRKSSSSIPFSLFLVKQK